MKTTPNKTKRKRRTPTPTDRTTHPIFVDLPDIPSELRFELPLIPWLEVEPAPFILVKPLSFQWRCFIREQIQAAGLEIQHETEIHEYELLTRYYYDIAPKPAIRYQWLMLARELLPETYNRGYVFILDRKHLNESYLITALKYHIRAQIGIIPYHVRFLNNEFVLENNHLHTPDSDLIDWEFNALVQLCLTDLAW